MSKKITLEGLDHFKDKENAMIAGKSESTNTATVEHAVGEYFYWKGVLHIVTAAIAVGGTIQTNTNVKPAVLADEVSTLKESINPLEDKVNFTHYGETLIPTNPTELQWIDTTKWLFNLEYVKNKIIGTLELLKDHTGGRNVAYSLASSGFDLVDMRGKKCRVTFHDIPNTVYVLITGSNADKTSSRTWSLLPTENAFVFDYNTFKAHTNEDYLFINGFYCGSNSSLTAGTSFYFEFEIADENEVALGWNVNDRVNNVYDLLPEKCYTFDDYLIKGINHRGYSTVAPENTLPAYRLSKQKGFSFVETDIAKTSDGVYVLLHDLTINRTARNSDGSKISTAIDISSITYTQALTYDFGIWKSNEYAGTKIPTFEEFIILCRNLKLFPYIELKALTIPLTQTDIENIYAIVSKYGMEKSVTWISSNYGLLSKINSIDNNARIGMTSATPTYDFSSLLAFKKPTNEIFIDFSVATLTNNIINFCIENNIPLEVYSPNTEQAMLALDNYVSGASSDLLNFEEVLRNANIGEANSGIIT